ncbi:hypothetical protein BB561_000800 [Smittium simulii]|uniref:Transcriptional coactivator Hfi1/Transcriptional adapter 1 n=1 Tax=Smittium simulii TaxID=133385 RepID=A0A2T9YXH1_9FUNG|nr:hypothetical protein BB561_000800 [Smittium simulii]
MDAPLTQSTEPQKPGLQRVELLDVKEQLVEAMGDSGKQYWLKLKAFIVGKLSMQEFESFFRDALVGENARIHNTLILNILKNANSKERPPNDVINSGFDHSKKRKTLDSSEKLYRTEYQLLKVDRDLAIANQNNSFKKQKVMLVKTERLLLDKIENPTWSNLKDIIKNMNKHDKKALKYLLSKKRIVESPIDQAIKMFERIVIPVPSNRLPPTYALDIAKGVVCSLCYDTKSTPDMKTLQARMVSIALQRGLVAGVTKDSVELLLYGLDCHLKNIASNMISKVRSNRSIGIPVKNPFFETENKDVIVDSKDFGFDKKTKFARLSERICQSKNTLHLSDLLFSLDISPFIAVENPACLERGFSMLSNQEIADQTVDAGKKVTDLSNTTNTPTSSQNPDHKILNYYPAEVSQNPHIKLYNPPENIIYPSNNSKEGSSEDIREFQLYNKNRLKAQYERHYGPYVSTKITPET